MKVTRGPDRKNMNFLFVWRHAYFALVSADTGGLVGVFDFSLSIIAVESIVFLACNMASPRERERRRYRLNPFQFAQQEM